VELRQLAWDLLHILNSPDTSGASGLIAGKVKQLDLEMVQGEPTRVFLRRWGQAVRGIAASLGIDASGMHVVTPRVLSSAPGMERRPPTGIVLVRIVPHTNIR
jgi:hypothetical protein